MCYNEESNGERVGSLQERVDKRGKRKRRFTFFFLLFLVMLALYSFLHSAFFTVKGIVVNGNEYFTRDEILSFASLVTGRNIFSQDTKAAENALNTQPRIAHATVRKVYPDKLQVDLKEREPVAILSYGGSYLELDKSGYVLGVLGEREPLELPLITGQSPSFVRTGTQIEQDEIIAAASIAGALGPDLSRQVAEINAKDPQKFILLMISHVEVWWGPATQLPEKAAVLATLTGELADHAGKLLDIRTPKSPVLR